MESPRNHGRSEEEEEEYSSCESGWTMYIEDAFHGNDHSSIVVDDDEDDDGCDIDDDAEVKEADEDCGDEESDDSMASDASSGPSNQFPKSISKHAAKKNGSKQVYLQKRQHAEKTISNEEEQEQSELKAKTRASAASRVQIREKMNKPK
ncbi:unnamed protein product [Cochlearia groenlandica]